MATIDQLELKKYNDISTQYGILKDQLHLGKSFDDFKSAIQEGNLKKIDDNLKILNQQRQDFMDVQSNQETLSNDQKHAFEKLEKLTQTRTSLTDLQKQVRDKSEKIKTETESKAKETQEKTEEDGEKTDEKKGIFQTIADTGKKARDSGYAGKIGVAASALGLGVGIYKGISWLFGDKKEKGSTRMIKGLGLLGLGGLAVALYGDEAKKMYEALTNPGKAASDYVEGKVDEAKKAAGETVEKVKDSVKDTADDALTAVGGGDLINDSKTDKDPNNPDNKRALPDEKEREALMMAQEVVIFDEYSRPYILGKDGQRFYPKIQQEFVGIENGPKLMQQTLGATTFYKMQLLKDYVDIRSMQAQKIGATRNNFNSNRGRDEGKLIKGDAESVTNRYYSHMMNEVVKNTQTPAYQNLSEGQKRTSNNAIALKYMNFIFEDMNHSEQDREIIFGDSNPVIQSTIKGFVGKTASEFATARLTIYQSMRKDTGENFKDIIGIGGGNSEGVKENLQTTLLNRLEYTKLKNMLTKDSKIVSLLATSNGQAQVEQIKNQLISIGLPQESSQELAEDVIEEYNDLKVTHEKRRLEYKTYLNNAFDNFKTQENKQDLIQFVATKYNRTGLSYEQSHEIALDGLIKDAVVASTLLYLKDECFYHILKAKEKLGGEEELLGSILGISSGGIFADKYMDWVVEGGVNIALCLIPMGAGLVAAKMATGAVRGVAVARAVSAAEGTREAVSTAQALQAWEATNWTQKAAQLGFEGAKIQKTVGVGLATGAAVVGGSAMYAGSLSVQAAIDKHMSFFEGWSNKELIKNIAMWGILSNLGQVLQSNKLTKIPENATVGPKILGQTGHILAEGGAMTGVNMGIDQVRDGEAHWSWGEFLQGLILIAAFKSAGKMVELKPGESIMIKKVQGKLSLWKGNIEKKLGKNKSVRETQSVNEGVESGFVRPTVTPEVRADIVKKIEGLKPGESLEYEGHQIKNEGDGFYSKDNGIHLKSGDIVDSITGNGKKSQSVTLPKQNNTVDHSKSKVEEILERSQLSKQHKELFFKDSTSLFSDKGIELKVGTEKIQVRFDGESGKFKYYRKDGEIGNIEVTSSKERIAIENKMLEFVNTRMHSLKIMNHTVDASKRERFKSTRVGQKLMQGKYAGSETLKYKTPVIGDIISMLEQQQVFGLKNAGMSWTKFTARTMFGKMENPGGLATLSPIKFGRNVMKIQPLFTVISAYHAFQSEDQTGLDAIQNIALHRIWAPLGIIMEGTDIAADQKDEAIAAFNDLVKDIPFVGDSLKIS